VCFHLVSECVAVLFYSVWPIHKYNVACGVCKYVYSLVDSLTKGIKL